MTQTQFTQPLTILLFSKFHIMTQTQFTQPLTILLFSKFPIMTQTLYNTDTLNAKLIGMADFLKEK